MTCSNFNALVDQIRDCSVCVDQLPLGSRPIIQVSKDAKILIAGQAPGKRVHESGVPFDDPSGDRLRDWLNVSRDEFYNPELFAIIPMGFCYPGTGKNGDLPPRKECAELWRAQLIKHLENIELVLAIGAYSINEHLPKTYSSLTNAVIHWQEFWPKILPMPHPSPRNNRWLKQNPWFEQDIIPRLRTRIDQLARQHR